MTRFLVIVRQWLTRYVERIYRDTDRPEPLNLHDVDAEIYILRKKAEALTPLGLERRQR